MEDDATNEIHAAMLGRFEILRALTGEWYLDGGKAPPETDPRELRISLVGDDGLELGDGEPGSSTR